MKVTVLGAGIMGSGIAQAAAMAGHEVRLNDASAAALDRGAAAIETSLRRFVKAGRLSEEEAAAARRRVACETDLEQSATDAEVAIETISEDRDAKWDLLSRLEQVVPDQALLATNTSQISITVLASVLERSAERFIGMHFFNPPVMMELCELIPGLRTEPATLARAREFAEGLGKTVIVCRKDSPGFITSRVAAMLRLECLRMLEEGIADAEDIDTALRLGFNHPMGPLELGDFNGLDTYLQALSSLTEAYGERFRPTVGLKAMVAAGRLGRKSGEGFYKYSSDGSRIS